VYPPILLPVLDPFVSDSLTGSAKAWGLAGVLLVVASVSLLQPGLLLAPGGPNLLAALVSFFFPPLLASFQMGTVVPALLLAAAGVAFGLRRDSPLVAGAALPWLLLKPAPGQAVAVAGRRGLRGRGVRGL
jgi:hypothetical protein